MYIYIYIYSHRWCCLPAASLIARWRPRTRTRRGGGRIWKTLSCAMESIQTTK